MSILTPKKIANITGGEYVGSENAADTPITGAVRDNRHAVPGNLFVCIQGERVDGHTFANAAFEAGASCCLTEKAIPDAKGPYVIVKSSKDAISQIGQYYRETFNIPIIGITGSVGKTTGKELLAAVLGSKLNALKTEKNMNNELGVALTLLSLNERHEAAVIEMGISDFGEMSRLAQMVKPDIFVITKIGYSHIKELGNLSGVLRAKTEAFAYMKPDGIAVLNGDDEYMMCYDPGIKKIEFGCGGYNDCYVENIRLNETQSVEFEIVSETGRFAALIPAYGYHLAELAPAAVCISRLLGLTDDEIIDGFLSYTVVEGRSNVSIHRGITLIDDCYNANPDSVKAALKSMAELSGRHVAILGDMKNLGEISNQAHHEVGIFAAYCGVEFLISHGECAHLIHDGYVSAGGKIARHYPYISELIEDIPGLINKGDVILVKASRDMHFECLLSAIKGKSW